MKRNTMKKIIILSALTFTLTVFLTGCTKGDLGYDENYWLSKERGVIVYSDYCNYYVVETAYGYTILRAWDSYKPIEGAIVYGNFSNYGTQDFYNRSSRLVFTAEVKEYWLSYNQAQQSIYYYCPYRSGRNNQRCKTVATK